MSLAIAGAPLCASPGNDLVKNSPFVPEDWSPEPPRQARARPTPPRQPQPLDKLEFRSIANFGGKRTFSLFDPTQNRSYWLGIDETEAGFTVVDYQEKEDSVVVRHEGRTRTVPLHVSKIQAMAQEAPPAQRQGGGQSDRTERAAEATTPEERMQNLAEEIRRRREIRRALVEGNQPPGGGNNAAPQNQSAEPPIPPSPEF